MEWWFGWMFIIFVDLWWKYFGTLEAWICKVSLFCSILEFPKALSLIQVNFEILKNYLNDFSLNALRIQMLKFLEILEFDSSKVSRLLNMFPCDSRKPLFIGVLGWCDDTWLTLTIDTHHNLNGWTFMSCSLRNTWHYLISKSVFI